MILTGYIVCCAQSVDDIKNNRMYLWGEGNRVTLNEADKNALSMLINQISVDVESKFELEKTENDAGDISKQVKSIVNTYSSASLHNTERIVVNQEPEAKVLRYIKRTDVSKIFKNRDKILQYNRYNKQEYINRLKVLFNSKEYINLQFEKSDIRAGDKDHVYGIQIKQNYYSSNYGDEGYLFLMVDLQDTSKPTIHVRTWQPNKDEKGNIYGIEDF